MRMSQSFYAKTHTGRLLSRITSDVDALENLMLEKFIYFLQNILISFLIIGIIFYINVENGLGYMLLLYHYCMYCTYSIVVK